VRFSTKQIRHIAETVRDTAYWSLIESRILAFK